MKTLRLAQAETPCKLSGFFRAAQPKPAIEFARFLLFWIPVNLKICQVCKRPFLAEKEFCPKCPPPYAWNQESWVNVGCLAAMIVLPLGVIFLFWFFFFVGIFMR